MRERYISVESPDVSIYADFITEGVTVQLSIVQGKLEVKACVSHGEDASTWDVHEASWKLRED